MCHDSVVVDIAHSIHDKTETFDGQIPNSAVECSIVENDGVVRGRIPYSSDADNEIRCDMQCMSVPTRNIVLRIYICHSQRLPAHTKNNDAEIYR